MLSGRFLCPVPGSVAALRPGQLAELARGVSLVHGGGFTPGSVARSLLDGGILARTLWLRPSPLDSRGDHLACSLAAAAGRLPPDEPPVLLVIETAEAIHRGGALGALLSEAAAGRGPPTLVVSHRRPARWLRKRAGGALRSALDVRTIVAGAPSSPGADLGPEAVEGLALLTRRSPGMLLDILEVARAGEAEEVLGALAGARRPRQLADRLTERLIASRGPGQLETLRQALATGYAPPDPEAADDPPPGRPWLVPLERGWSWLSPRWAPSLWRALKGWRAEGPAARTRPARWAPSPPPPSEPAPEPEPVPRRAGGAERPLLETALIAGGAGPEGTPEGDGSPVLRVRMLGSFEVSVGGVRVESWHGQRGPMLLKFLLARRDRSCPRDVLMDAFWPDVDPDHARNRLHVALSALRRSLRTVIDEPVVEFREGSYRIGRGLRLEVDVDAFERAVERGRTAQREQSASAAIDAYASALDLYRDDLLTDALYEDWTVMPRETLRSEYLDTLDRITALLMSEGRLAECVTATQRILEQDPCREDAHRLLMRCYARQGRAQQVAHQYELCRRAMSATLDCEPSPETRDLLGDLGGADAQATRRTALSGR